MSALTSGVCVHAGDETSTQYRKVTEQRPTPNSTIPTVVTRTVPDRDVTASLEIWIDYVSLIRQMGAKAIRSKGRVAKIANGAVVIKVAKLRTTKEYPK